MKKLLCIILMISLIGCGKKKTSLHGDEIITGKDFIEAFTVLQLPFTIADTNIVKAAADTSTISLHVFNQFVPDTTLSKLIPSIKKSTITPIGKINKQKEIYLLANFTHNKKTTLCVFVFNEKNKFLTAKQLLSNSNDDEYLHLLSVNKEPTFLISREKTDENKQLRFSRTGWVYNNSSNNFIVVINDGNEDPKKTQVIDPIDTLPRKNKLSGNYVKDSKNFISVRDGRDANTYHFFIHFEKKDGNCTGELKGTLRLKDATHGVYTEGGDPCSVDFSFEENTIVVKEKGSCGNRRGMDCLFDDTYIKKKETKPKKKK
jgi:hypothetical protein